MVWIVTHKEVAVWFLISNFALLKNYNTVSFIFEGVLTFLTPTVVILGKTEADEGSVVVGCGTLSLRNWSVMFWRSSAFTFKGLEFQEENFKTCQNRSANVTVNSIARKFFCCNNTPHCVHVYIVITHTYCMSCYALIIIKISAEWTENKDLILGRVRYSSSLHQKFALGKLGGFLLG